jgi:hypothetical protein
MPPVLRFKVSFEDYEDISRVIDIKPGQTFLDLHQAICTAIKFQPDFPSSFYMSNDQWLKGKEIAYKASKEQIEKGIKDMESSKINAFIETPHQKIYYIFDHKEKWSFQIELVGIEESMADKVYPLIVKETGEAPKQFGLKDVPIIPSTHHDDIDFLNEHLYAVDESEIPEDFNIESGDSPDKDGFEGENEGDGEDSDEFSNESEFGEEDDSMY